MFAYVGSIQNLKDLKDPTPHSGATWLRVLWWVAYSGTSIIRNCRFLGPYGRTMPRALWESKGGERFFMSEVPL